MRTTIDGAGRVVVPKPVRVALGLSAGTELDCEARDGEIRMTVPSRVRREEGPNGPRFAADDASPLTADVVRDLLERGRR